MGGLLGEVMLAEDCMLPNRSRRREEARGRSYDFLDCSRNVFTSVRGVNGWGEAVLVEAYRECDRSRSLPALVMAKLLFRGGRPS